MLVTLGVEPKRPETCYGYIQVGKPAGRGHGRLRQVRRFVEKPSLARARRYLAGGGYLWNAGVFVWRADVLLEEVERWAPALHTALVPLHRRPRSRSGAGVRRGYAAAPSVPVDVAILERSQRVWTLPVRFAWSDVGTWLSLAEELGVGRRGRGRSQGAERDGNRLIAGEMLAVESSGNLVWGDDRLVALLGVEGLAVIDSGDVILVTQLDCSPDVRRLVALLNERGRVELT